MNKGSNKSHKVSLLTVTAMAATAIAIAFCPLKASAVVLIDGTTTGAYNASLGTVLDCGAACGNVFPLANVASGDPTLTVNSAPDLSAASGFLGNWLSNTITPTGTGWSGAPVAIPATWAINTETAIVYQFSVTQGIDNLVSASFGVDNGIFVWLDGTFVRGELRGGTAIPGEHVFNLGSLSTGTHYLQVLREDHGGATGYNINVTGVAGATSVPEPGAIALLAVGLLTLGVAARRKRSA